MHSLNAEWKLSSRVSFRANAAWQTQKWDVDFYDGFTWTDSIGDDDRFAGKIERKAADYLLALDKSTWNIGGEANLILGDSHALTLGLQREARKETYYTFLPRPYFNWIVNGNADFLEGLSFLSPRGLKISNKEADSFGEISLIDIVNRQRFDYQGKQEPAFGAAYVADRWDITAKARLEMGMRLEHAEAPNQWFLSPRLSWHQQLGSNDELSVGLGRFAQSDLPFETLDANPNLVPEKAWQASAGITHDFGSSIQFQFEYWYKRYEDLVALDLLPAYAIDWEHMPIDSTLFAKLDSSRQRLFATLYGYRRFSYSNDGIGEAQGLEWTLRYKPTPIWTGWLSWEQSVSRRQDHRGEPWYAANHHRPWALNWVNWWHFPKDYALGLRWRYAAGEAYTATNQSLALDYGFANLFTSPKDSLFTIGPRNSARYAPYMRFDLRISHDTQWFGHPAETYFEIWNVFNSPNLIQRDRDSGKFKALNTNYPFPILFFGFRWRY